MQYTLHTYNGDILFIWVKTGKNQMQIFREVNVSRNIQYAIEGEIFGKNERTPVMTHCTPNMLLPGEKW